MKNALFACLLIPNLAGCATDPYHRGPDVGARVVGGALLGTAVGAVAGKALGTDPVVGAAAGMVVGGAAGAATGGSARPRQYYRDTRGYCYYVDSEGRPQYDPAVRC